MFIIFNKTTHAVLTYGQGYPHVKETDGKLKIANTVICNDAGAYGWKYITDTSGDIVGADERDYPELEKPLDSQEIKEQIEAINAVVMDLVMGGV